MHIICEIAIITITITIIFLLVRANSQEISHIINVMLCTINLRICVISMDVACSSVLSVQFASLRVVFRPLNIVNTHLIHVVPVYKNVISIC